MTSENAYRTALHLTTSTAESKPKLLEKANSEMEAGIQSAHSWKYRTRREAKVWDSFDAEWISDIILSLPNFRIRPILAGSQPC